MNSEWTAISDHFPTAQDRESPLLIVAAQEFGQPWVYAVARCWISTAQPLMPKFYLDRGFYGLDTLLQVAQPVYYWRLFPTLQED